MPELKTSVFLIGGDRVKNEEHRLVVLNRVAPSVLDSARGEHPEWVFVISQTAQGKARPRAASTKRVPLKGMNEAAWNNRDARRKNVPKTTSRQRP